MRRNVTAVCPLGHSYDVIASEDETIPCREHGIPCTQDWLPRVRRTSAEWHPSEWATVFRKPDGTYSFPARADKPTPDGCERITLKSDRDFARIEREAKVQSEARWMDRGSGKGLEWELRPVPTRR